MTTRPQFDSLDLADPSPLLDLAIARASLLPREQHALMSGWGGPPQCRACMFVAENGASNTYTISYRVPPGVTDVDVAALLYGDGTLTLTTSADATGTRMRSVGASDNVSEGAVWVTTNGSLDDDNGAESGRALTMRAAVAWTWVDTDITVVIDAAGSDDLYLWALTFKPIHITR